MDNQFLRTQMLLGGDAMNQLHRSHVAVFGLGGVGSYAVEALVRSGVGELTLIDDDTVSPTNLNRQLEALHSTVGQNKTDALAARCRDGGTRRLLQIARTLLEDETRFFADMEVLFALLGEDGAYLHACVQRCPVQQAPYTALAALILFALLGPEELRRLVDSPREAARYFYII